MGSTLAPVIAIAIAIGLGYEVATGRARAFLSNLAASRSGTQPAAGSSGTSGGSTGGGAGTPAPSPSPAQPTPPTNPLIVFSPDPNMAGTGTAQLAATGELPWALP